MAGITEVIALPNQPASGFTQPRPLGGDGKRSPFQQTVIRVNLEGDASGSNIFSELRFDPTYLNLVTTIQVSMIAAVADVAVRCLLQFGPGAGTGFSEWVGLNRDIPFNAGPSTIDNMMLWSPPPQLMLDNNKSGDSLLQVEVPNTDGETLIVAVWTYQFDKRAAEWTAPEHLLSVVPRAGNVVT